MIEHEYFFRVKYPDTDQMGTIHHSNYPKYCETARWELFRNMGLTYRQIEEEGFLLPVVSMNFRFIKTTHYDERLRMVTTLKSVKGVRLCFTYRLYNEVNELINEADTVLAFVSRETWKPCVVPDFVLNAITAKQNKQLQHA